MGTVSLEPALLSVREAGKLYQRSVAYKGAVQPTGPGIYKDPVEPIGNRGLLGRLLPSSVTTTDVGARRGFTDDTCFKPYL